MFKTYLERFGQYERYAWLLSGVALLALLVAGLFHKMGGYGVETDFYWAYAPDAQRIATGEMPQEPGVGPGYALMLVFLNMFLDDWFVSGRTLSILATVICGLFTFKFIQSVFDEKLAFYTLLIWLVTVLPWSLVASTDMFFAMLVAASIYFFYRNGVITNKNLVLSGLLMGFTYMTRHNGVVLPIGVAIILIFLNPENWDRKTKSKGVFLFALCFILVNLPWSLIQLADSGEAVRSDSYLIIASHFYGKPGVVSSEDMRLAAQQFTSLWSVISYDVAYFAKHYLSNIYRHFYDVLINSIKFPSFLFVAGGLFFMIPQMNRKQGSLFVFPVLSFLLLCLVHYEPRYYLYIISFLVVFVAYFLCSPQDSSLTGSQVKWRAMLRYGALASIIIFLSTFSIKEIRKNVAEEPRELLKIAEELQGKVQAEATIIARKPHLAFLANLQTIYFPEATSVEDLLAFAREEKADYLLYGEMENKRRPELRGLLEPGEVSGELEPIYVWENPKTIIYKFNFALSESAVSGG